ncbi:MAG: hypothetical protein J6U69_02465 [Alistipes sp.]|nr:hypothetical protein [Alistipes sp.]
MVRYPFYLEYLYEADAVQRPDGSYQEGTRVWRKAGRCNAVQNTNARTITAQNGEVRAYSYEITRPAGACPITEGTPVRVLDRAGNNIFAMACPHDDNHSEATYAVQGNDTRNQRYAKTRLWV